MKMTNKVKRMLIAGTFAISCGTMFTSCGGGDSSKSNKESSTENKIQNDELKAFMLGGIYFENGYGGKSATETHANQNGTKPQELVEAYSKLFIFPFNQGGSEGSGAKQMLDNYWDVKSKDSLLAVLDKLKTHKMESSHTKAWDYARYVNNVCLGYAAGYLTKEEGSQLVQSILPQAKVDYKSWDDYFVDFAIGRDKWNNEETPDKKALDELAKTIPKGDNNIYQILPLN